MDYLNSFLFLLLTKYKDIKMKTITRFTDFFYIITEMHITIIMKAHKKNV